MTKLSQSTIRTTAKNLRTMYLRDHGKTSGLSDRQLAEEFQRLYEEGHSPIIQMQKMVDFMDGELGVLRS